MWQISPEFITDSTQHKIKFTVKKGQKETVPKKKKIKQSNLFQEFNINNIL